MSSTVPTAGSLATPTTPAATGTARNARVWRADWLEARQAELLPVPYFPGVFTVPAPVADLAFHNKAAVYGSLVHAAAEALRSVAAAPRYLGAELGAIAVLHTPGSSPGAGSGGRLWGQALHHHPHLHCSVPGGGLSPDHQRWIACPPGVFLPGRGLSHRFRDGFVRALRTAFAAGALRFPGALAALADRVAVTAWADDLARIDGVVSAKPPFAGPEQVLGYLGRYTHRVALANSRLVGIDDGQVSFAWKNYRQHGKTKVMTLAADECSRRCLQHTVPDGVHRIRHIGFLANRHRTRTLALCRELLAAPPEPRPPRRWQDHLRDRTGQDIEVCPCCGGRMLTCGTIPPQPPPRPAMGCDSS